MGTQTVSVIGLGAMGTRLAQNLLKSDYSVVVYNRTADKARALLELGAVVADTPRAAAEQSDVVISMSTDDESSRHIWLAPETGAADGLTPGKIAIEMSTLTLDWVQALSRTLGQRDINFLEAPVVGSRPQAEAGTLMALVGGDSETLKQVRSILTKAGAGAIQYIGPVGQGMAMKLAVNALFGVQVAALAEVMGMLSKCQIPPEKTMECLGDIPVLSLAAKGAGALMVKQAHEPLFPIRLVEKDLRYIMSTAKGLGAGLPTSKAVMATYRDAIAKGYQNSNITGIAQLFV